VEDMNKILYSRIQLILGILGLLIAAMYPFIDSWNNPDLARFNVLLWASLGGMFIYSSQKIKYEGIIEASKKPDSGA
jgi:hypothetical protein